MNKNLQNVIYICAGIVGFIVANQAANYFLSGPSPSKVAEEAYDEILDNAKNYNNEYEAENIAESSKAYLKTESEKLAGEEKKNMIFASFVGFKYRQTVATYNYCVQHGVKIDNFVHVFNDLNKDVASVVDNEMPKNFKAMALIPEVKKSINKLVVKEFQEIKRLNGLEPQTICAALATATPEVTANSQFSTVLPDAYQFIMSFAQRR